MARAIKHLHMDEESLKELRRRAKARTATVREQQRASIVILRAKGMSVSAVAEKLGTTAKRVSIWSKRFASHGLAGLEDKRGRGRRPSIPAAKVARVIDEATRPPKGRERWSVRSMGRHVGISHSTVQRIWSRNDLTPHITKTFKLSTIRNSRRNSGT